MSPLLKSNFANRGVKAEKAVHAFLDAWAKNHIDREYSRLTDSKAAGRTIKAADADFAYYWGGNSRPHHGLIEVKETKHGYRLERGKLTQLPRLRKREACGGECVVLIYHSEIGYWRYQTPETLEETGEKGSWNLDGWPIYVSPGQALAAFRPVTFGDSA